MGADTVIKELGVVPFTSTREDLEGLFVLYYRSLRLRVILEFDPHYHCITNCVCQIRRLAI